MTTINPKAAKVIDLIALLGVSSIACGGTDVGYSASFMLPQGSPDFSLEYQATSSGSVKLQIDIETGKNVPTTEGSADSAWTVDDDSSAQINSDLTDENLHKKGFTPIADGFARVKITGVTGNDATTVLSTCKLKIMR